MMSTRAQCQIAFPDLSSNLSNVLAILEIVRSILKALRKNERKGGWPG